ncbi:oligogalacturonate lyase family protein [Flavobacterium sp. ZT3R25]|uniref:oligogalacturonate lyase family protein n=1 Tax=Flavobacterium galactosi TaxID=3398735 RepID=UPI003A89458B
MRTHKIVLAIVILFCFSCKEKQSTISNQSKIPVLETSKESSLATVWIDSETGHKIEKLIDRKGNNSSFYFHNNPFLPTKNKKGWLMVFYGSTPNGSQLFTIDLKTKNIVQITNKSGSKSGEIVGDKTRKVYYRINDSIFATHIDTHETTFIFKFPTDKMGSITTLNADETMLGGVISSKEEQEIMKKYPEKKDFFDRIYDAKLERTLITIDVANGSLKELFSEKSWLNHEQFSPTDPKLLMYCHEGPWHKVDRIWNVNIDTKNKEIIHKRTIEREIAGHEFFSPDGKTIWFDLQIPRGETFYLAGKNLKNGEEKRYALQRDEWSIHYNIAPDLKSFAGDGGNDGQVAHAKDGRWIYHFIPKGDNMVSTKLVNMKNHNYKLEPNVHFSPDGKLIIFRANFEGNSQIYAVAIDKFKQ